MAKRQNIVFRSEVFYHLHTESFPSPLPLSPPPPISTFLAKAWPGLIMKRAVTVNQRNQRISYEMRSQWNQSIISREW